MTKWIIGLNKYVARTTFLVVTLLLLSACTEGQVYKVESKSMEPLYPANSYVTVVPISPSDLQRGDVIVFRYPYNKDETHVKRLIGLPGDTIEIRDGGVYLNEELLVEEYVAEGTKGKQDTVTVGEEKYYVIGDNRSNSADSRTRGAILAEDIVGIVKVTTWNKFLNRIESE